MSQFHSLDRVLAQDDSFREFFTALTGGKAGPDQLNGANTAVASSVTDPASAVTDPLPADNQGPATALSADWATSSLDAGPHWAMNSVWTIPSLSVNYGGDPNHPAGTGGTHEANPPIAMNSTPATDSPPANEAPATNPVPVTGPATATASSPATTAGQDPSSNTHHHADGASVAHEVSDAASIADHQAHSFEHTWA
jgi:hypothetical protein